MNALTNLAAEIRQYARARLVLKSNFEKTIQELRDKYPNTPYYYGKSREAEAEYHKQLESIGDESARKINALLAQVRGCYENREAKAPSEAQLRTLQVLDMRKKVSADELQEAANLCRGVPVTYGLISEIAKRSGVSVQIPEEQQASISYMTNRTNSFVYNMNRMTGEGRWLEQVANADDEHIIGRMFGVGVVERTGDYNEAAIKAIYKAVDGVSLTDDEPGVKVIFKADRPSETQEKPSDEVTPIWESNGL